MAPEAVMCGHKLGDNKLGQQHCPLIAATSAIRARYMSNIFMFYSMVLYEIRL